MRGSEGPLGIGARTVPPLALLERSRRERRALLWLGALLAGVAAGVAGRWLWRWPR